MENRWKDEVARLYRDSDLDTRVYSSRLLGQEPDLVLHGGGNTSVKVVEPDLFGDERELLYVKGSGWDLATIDPGGFAALLLEPVRRLGSLEKLSDPDMMRSLRAALIDPDAPVPSVETILHALIPRKFVDHTHADVVVAISNTANGQERLKRLFGPRVLVLPYVMPGFILARQAFEATRDVDWKKLEAIVLLNHGMITFGDTARESYDRMIQLVSRAEEFLRSSGASRSSAARHYEPQDEDLLTLASIRRRICQLAGAPMLVKWERDEVSVGYSSIAEIEEIAVRGPLTPDHVLHTKPFPAMLDDDHEADLERFALDYQRYYRTHSMASMTPLDFAPRFAIWRGKGVVCCAPNESRLRVVRDLVSHTARAVQWGQALGGWQPLTRGELFAVEYWDLEQAKLQRGRQKRPFEGRVAVVTGGASGIGAACVDLLVAQGASVIALDIDPKITEQPNGLGILCDVTDPGAIELALAEAVEEYGGIDLVVSNAGSFPDSARLEELTDDVLSASLDLNFTSHQRLLRAAIPFLKLGWEPSVVLIASKNVPAPGPGAAAYSTAKAALTQLGRVAALELGAEGIRVNMIHPNAVFDTGIWRGDVVRQRAEQYGMSEEQYRTNNLLHTEVSAQDVAAVALALASSTFAKTTGAQIAVDGGNERVV